MGTSLTPCPRKVCTCGQSTALDSASSDCGCNRLTTAISNALDGFKQWVSGAYDTLVNSKTPSDTVPIDETKWSADHTGIKGQSLAGPKDDVRIGASGDVWVQRPGGSWENTGNANYMIDGGDASGRRGKDREPSWKQDRGRKQRGDW